MSDVKGWSPEYQSILESFDMINNKYENPDVSKDLNIAYVNAWRTGNSSPTYVSSFTWNTPLNPNIANGVGFEIYAGNSDHSISIIDFNNISNFLHIYNNEKKDRMIKIFQIPKMSNYNETEKPKRMEMGYYCKDKKEFKTLFNNQSFTNGKHIINNGLELYYMIHNGYFSDATKPTTIGDFLTFLKDKTYSQIPNVQSLVYRHFKTVNNYLSGIDSMYSMIFIPSFNNDYSGGGIN